MPQGSKVKLWKSFGFSLIKSLLLLAIPISILNKYFWQTIFSLFSKKVKINEYADLIPLSLRGKSWSLSKTQFILGGVFLVFVFFLLTFFFEFQTRKLIIDITDYLKNQTLKKFRKLNIEEKTKSKKEIVSIIERESEITGWYWVNFWRKMFEGGLSIAWFFFFYFQSKNTEYEIGTLILLIAFLWIFLISGTVYLFYKYGFRSNRLSKQKINQEHGFINEEVNNSILIDSMGLEDSYETKQQRLTRQSAWQKVKVKKLMGLEITIPWKLLIYLFPFVLLIIEPNFIGASLATIWNILSEGAHSFSYLGRWTDYAVSRNRIDTFLTLSERNDNLEGVKISTATSIKKVVLEKVSFKYQGGEREMNFNQTFTEGKINYLTTPNGSGKTTQIYLLLRLLNPRKGKIIIEMTDGTKYDLSDINGIHWRSENIAFCSHQTLIKEGSTGQKQLANLKQILKNKNQAQIFIFDEADNALDKQNQTWFQTQLEKLVKKNKIVIWVRQLQKV